jgi:hypothetical protein
MESHSGIICGGGWRERRECRVKFKAVCCMVLIFPALGIDDQLADYVGVWSVILPAALLVTSIILFCFERPAVFWGFPDARCPDLDAPLFGKGATDTKTKADNSEGTAKPCPEYDIHKLY